MLGAVGGTALVFAVSGALQASWLSRLPALQARIGADFRGLGFALAALGVGTVGGMLTAGRLSHSYSSRTIAIAASVASALSIMVVPFGAGLVGFGAALLVFGFATGALDAAMNIQGSTVEQKFPERHLLARFHGFWSIGTVVGAGTGAAFARLGWSMTTQCAVVAVLTAVLCWTGTRGFLHDLDHEPQPRFQRNRRFWALGTLILLGALIEGAANDWLAVYLHEGRGLSHASAASGYTIFVLAMAVGRFLAEVAHARFTAARTVAGGAVISAAGVLITVLTPAVVAGVALWGLGISAVFPAVISASRTLLGSREAVAAMTTLGYGAGLLGPIGLGAIAGGTRLGSALLLLPLCAAAVALLSRLLASPAPS